MTPRRYRGQVVAITGAASGLGAAMANRFAAEGARVALMDVDPGRLDAKAAEFGARGQDALALAVDVAHTASLQAVADQVRTRLGGCHVLCANVGVQQFGALDALTQDDWRWVMSVNFHGAVNTVDAFLPLLRAQAGRRRIVLTSSASVFQVGVRMGAYVASKYALTGYGEVLRRELAAEGIEVSLLFPAGMRTRHLQSSQAARPAALGPSRLDRRDVEAMIADAGLDMAEHLRTAEEATRTLLDELEAAPPYIFTHGGYREQIARRQHEVLEAYDRMAASAPAPGGPAA